MSDLPIISQVASNSDWFGQSNAYDSMISQKDVTGIVDELSCLLATQGLSKYTDVFLRCCIQNCLFSSKLFSHVLCSDMKSTFPRSRL